MTKLIVALTLILFVPLSAMSRTLCGKGASQGADYGWCIEQPDVPNGDVLYYMHGGGGNETSWPAMRLNQDLTERWRSLGYGAPTVISISFGTKLLTDLPVDQTPALLPIFVGELMPRLERLIGGVRRHRLVAGHSLGGYNAAELALRYPSLFDRAAFLCPGLAVTDPFASDAAISDFIKRQPLSTKAELIWGVVNWIRRDFKTPAAWSRHDPEQLALRAARLKTSFFVSCTKDDEWGFHDGAQRVAAILRQKSDARFVSIESGGHCAETKESLDALALFLAGH